MKLPVTERALYLRLRRKLRGEGRLLRISRPHLRKQVGKYYLVAGKQVTEAHVDLEKLGRSSSTLLPWEEMVKE